MKYNCEFQKYIDLDIFKRVMEFSLGYFLYKCICSWELNWASTHTDVCWL